jgi:hypothetical protein
MVRLALTARYSNHPNQSRAQQYKPPDHVYLAFPSRRDTKMEYRASTLLQRHAQLSLSNDFEEVQLKGRCLLFVQSLSEQKVHARRKPLLTPILLRA